MASTFSTNLALELIGTGDQAGTWGNTTNTNLGTLLEQAISGYVTQAVATGTDTTITIPNGSTGVARNMYIELTGTGGASTNLIVPANKKLYFIFNNSTGAVTVKVSGLTGVSVPTGKKMVLVSNGTDIVNGLNYIADFGTNSFSVTNLTASSATITNLIATSGSITNLVSSDASATVLRAGSATITNLIATTGTITDLRSPTASATVLRSASATITNLIATTGTITTLSATSGSITNLVSSDASATVLRSGSATLTHLSATSATITNLTLTSLVISNLSIASANITTLTGTTFGTTATTQLRGDSANITTLTSTSANITTLTSSSGTITNLFATTATISSVVLVGTTTNTNGSRIAASGTISEGVGGVQYLVASQYDIGTDPNEIPLNQYLGALAYIDSEWTAPQVGSGITGGTGTICKTSFAVEGGVKKMQVLIDLTGLNSGGAAGDIIGVDGTANPCYIAQIPSTFTILGGSMTCLETPAGGDTDIDLYSATEGTGTEDTAITTLTETQIINAGTQSRGTVTYFAADPAANTYLYLVGQSTSNATYTAGRLLIEVFGA